MRFNRVQKQYIEAKAWMDHLEIAKNIQEKRFLIDQGIKNKDGSVPRHTWTIDDKETAEKAINDFSLLVEESGLWKSICDARAALEKAEEELLTYAISISPEEIRPILAKVKTSHVHRKEMIKIILQLDTSTVKR